MSIQTSVKGRFGSVTRDSPNGHAKGGVFPVAHRDRYASVQVIWLAVWKRPQIILVDAIQQIQLRER